MFKLKMHISMKTIYIIFIYIVDKCPSLWDQKS